jgi:hypothetical protein
MITPRLTPSNIVLRVFRVVLRALLALLRLVPPSLPSLLIRRVAVAVALCLAALRLRFHLQPYFVPLSLDRYHVYQILFPYTVI